MSYLSTLDTILYNIGSWLIIQNDDEKPTVHSLDLNIGMKVALFDGSTSKAKYVGMNDIDKCLPKGTWKGFQVPHSYFIMVNTTTVHSNSMTFQGFYELAILTFFGSSVKFRMLWSAYRVHSINIANLPHYISRMIL